MWLRRSVADLRSHIYDLERRHHEAAAVRDRVVELGLAGPLSEHPEDWAPFLRWAPPGHFYSPIPLLSEIDRRHDAIFGREMRSLPGIDLNEDGQRAMFESLAKVLVDWDFPEEADPKWRYFSGRGNFAYCLGDAMVLHGMLRHFQPRRLIEIGSGFSSCMTLDTNEHFLDNSVSLTFIEPYPELLYRLIGDRRGAATVHEKPVQDVDDSVFAALEAGDVLFIDSTHVAKAGSDVNHLFIHVLPLLKPGVIIHIHDVFWPFEYPEDWVREGRVWSELYLLRSFLQFNQDFEVLLFNDWFALFERALVHEQLPKMLGAPGGALWLRRR